MIRALLLLMLLLPRAAPANVTAAQADGLAWRTHPGAKLPLDVMLTNEAGGAVPLGDTFRDAPVILDIGYYRCPTLCGVIRADLLAALRTSGLSAGRDYALVAVSIDPAETFADAARAKAADLAQTPFTNGGGWHYLTGAPGAVAAIKDAVGFQDSYDERFKQFSHPAGITILTPEGTVSSYLLGLGYTGGDLRSAILRARAGTIEQAASPILLLCFHYDAATGRYTLAIEKLLRLMAALTVLTLGAMLAILHRRRPPGAP